MALSFGSLIDAIHSLFGGSGNAPDPVPPVRPTKSVQERAADFAAPFEGFRSRPYTDPAGVWTIGYGSTRDRSGVPVTWLTPEITDEEARSLMARDMQECESEIETSCKVPLTENQKVALMDFIYNLGAGNFRSSALLRKLNSGDYAGAAEEFGKWVHAGDVVLPGLVKRRAAEAALFRGTAARTLEA